MQAEMYRTYHMTNPNNFYNKDDVWAWPQEMFYNEPQPVQPYYVLMQLPGSDRIDYVQILPFTPANRDNMVAWMAAQSTLDKYGEIVVYEFGTDSLFFGPQQIEARIDQDPVISAQLSLWNQQGSSVVRGNLLVLPIGDSLLYVEPLYLQAENGKIPELKRVILATADRVVMGENLGQALVRLFGNDTVSRAGLADLVVAASANLPGGAPPTNVQPGLSATAGDLQAASLEQLILAANQHYTCTRSYSGRRLGELWSGDGCPTGRAGAVGRSHWREARGHAGADACRYTRTVIVFRRFLTAVHASLKVAAYRTRVAGDIATKKRIGTGKDVSTYARPQF
ncbi:MAG: UPF0182 family protein [Anaerolineales bacterium]|nr:UPF0182 family protein [Anaerolineales bacterium]